METATLNDGAVDPNVRIPKSVIDAGKHAEAVHKSAYAAPTEPAASAPVPPANTPAPDGKHATTAPLADAHAASDAQPPAAAQEAPPAQPAPPPPAEEVTEDSWKHRFLSMQGRYQSASRQLGEQAEMNRQLAHELAQTQALIQSNPNFARTQGSNQNTKTGHDHEKLITPNDVANYGEELIDVVRRAALETVSPELDALKQENEKLKKQVVSTAQRDIYTALNNSIPNWQAVNKTPEFHQWLSLRNIYTGQVRKAMLNAAFQAADAPTVVALFRDYMNEVKATGGVLPASQRQQQTEQASHAPVAPRHPPAMNLENLAAPGRAKPASGDTQVPVDKPTYTRAQISQNYQNKRRGLWAGRDNDWNRLEADMIAAGSEGRIR